MKPGASKQDSPFTIQAKFLDTSCPELLDRYMMLPMLIWKNTLILNYAVFSPNQALSGGLYV